MEISKEQKEAIEYLKTRLYGNEGCKYIDVAQEDLRIIINLVDRKEKDIEGWKKYCEEIEKEQTEMSNKNCELEFDVEKLQKENAKLKEENEYNKLLLDMNNNFTIDKKNGIYKWNVVEIQKVKDKIEELNKKEKEELKGMKGQDRYFVKQTYQNKRMILQELIKESEE